MITKGQQNDHKNTTTWQQIQQHTTKCNKMTTKWQQNATQYKTYNTIQQNTTKYNKMTTKW